jgi:hypothetical protein
LRVGRVFSDEAMRASLPHTLRERRRSRAARRHGESAIAGPSPSLPRAPTTTQTPDAPARSVDRAAQRVREAGGPTDKASYSCQCGFIFLAPVSTTVACPHCRAPQAW